MTAATSMTTPIADISPDRAGQHRADDQPEKSRQIPELRGQDRPEERASAGDSGKMMAEQHPAIGGMEVCAVIESVRRRDPPIVQLDDAPREEPAIEPVRQHVETGCGDHEPEPVDLLLWMENAGDDSEADRTERGDRGPEDRGESRHETMLARSAERCKGST